MVVSIYQTEAAVEGATSDFKSSDESDESVDAKVGSDGDEEDEDDDDQDVTAGARAADFYEDDDAYRCPACQRPFVDIDKLAVHLDKCEVGNPS